MTQFEDNTPDSPCAAMHFLTDSMQHVLRMDEDWETLGYHTFEILRGARKAIYREVYNSSYERNYAPWNKR